jgi:NAD(P)-dependent dehydrogenase (short-subunit alcohol dehydrogenase family)
MTSNNPLSPVLLILGAGPRIGQSVANAFAAKGYRVAVAARSLSPENSTADKLFIKADLSDPASISDIFAKVKELFGPPSVVVYNGSSETLQSPLSPF